MNNLLEIKNLNLIYKINNKSLQILKNINLSLKQKESISIVGESGLTANEMRAILGIPVFDYYISEAPSYNDIYDEIRLVDEADYPMGAATSGEGND